MNNFLTRSSVILILTVPLMAFSQSVPEFSLKCEEALLDSSKQVDFRFCEIRDFTMQAEAKNILIINGDNKGSVIVRGWDKTTIHIRAKIQGWSNSSKEAEKQGKSVILNSSNNLLRAISPNGNSNWAVSYEIFMPKKTSIDIKVDNGSLKIFDMDASINFLAINGSTSLENINGEIRGRIENGGLKINLSNTNWHGNGLKIVVNNGSIHWLIPPKYSARLLTGTDRGYLRTDFPNHAEYSLKKTLDIQLNEGGSFLKANTANGSVVIERKL